MRLKPIILFFAIENQIFFSFQVNQWMNEWMNETKNSELFQCQFEMSRQKKKIGIFDRDSGHRNDAYRVMWAPLHSTECGIVSFIFWNVPIINELITEEQ